MHLSRRRFLAMSALAASVAALATSSPGITQAIASTSDSDPAFLALARFLTGRSDLDPRIVTRARDALIAADSGFADKARTLMHAIQDANLTSVDAFAGSPLYADASHRATAIAVVSAFYLGQVGEGREARLVSFEKALMFQPTAGVLVIPSYALGGPNYWGKITSVPSD
jgi:hypothetical protein